MRHLVPLFLLAVAPILPAAEPAETEETTAESVAAQYGLAAWPEVTRLAFTFNIQAPDRTITRTWVWEPTLDQVTFTDASGKSTTYLRANAASTPELIAIDRDFINDSYWLLFPYHLIWDTGTTFTEEEGPLPLPTGPGEAASKLTVQYANEGGYTPGDAYDLFLDPDHKILAWTFRKGGAVETTLATSWSAPEMRGPILLSLDHHGPNNFRIWFSDVSVNEDPEKNANKAP